jgi:predicted unusual protein kinase regulating ubiquinone biosynthesis (AarF/ABC1/UbiB family)
MTFSAAHFKRYSQIARLLWKYGRSDIAEQMEVPDGFDAQELKAGEVDAAPEQLADDLEAMGPTYVKLGQVLAGRPDLLPKAYLKALSRLQDKVKPFAYEDVEQIILGDLGVRVSAGAGPHGGAARRPPGCGQGAEARHPPPDRR